MPIFCWGLGAAQELDRGRDTQKCPVCGFTQADFKKTGRLGCSACYETFQEGLGALLKTMHKGTQHVGKAPRRFEAIRQNEAKIQSLRQTLERVVASEQYEEAAGLRDEIRKLESESKP